MNMFFSSRRFLRTAFMHVCAGILLLAIAGVLTAGTARAIEERGDVGQCFLELIEGGPVKKDQRKFNGVRWVADALEFARCSIRRAAETVAGVDVVNPQEDRAQNNVIDAWGFSEKDKEALQSTTFANFYYPANLATLAGGSVISPPGPGGQLSVASTTNDIQDWNVFQSEKVPTTKNPFGKATLWRLALSERSGQIEEGLSRLAPPGYINPAFQGQQQLGSSQKPGSLNYKKGDPPLTDRVVAPAESTTDTARTYIYQLAREATVSNVQGAPKAVGSINDRIPSVRGDQSGVKTADGSSAVGAQLAYQASGIGHGQDPGGSIHDALALGGVLNSVLNSSANQINNLLANNPLANGINHFGPGGLGNLGGLFNPNRLSSLLGNRFPPTGGTGPGPRPTTQTNAPAGTCQTQQPVLSTTTVRDAADLLGLPITTSPWIVEYRPVSTITGTTGTNAETGASTTVNAATFPGQTCVWTVTANLPNGAQQVAIVSDTSAASGTQVRLIL